MSGIAVVGNRDFVIGFKLAGIKDTFIEEKIGNLLLGSEFDDLRVKPMYKGIKHYFGVYDQHQDYDIVIGLSAGGNLAVDLAEEMKFKKVVLISPLFVARNKKLSLLYFFVHPFYPYYFKKYF
jgi:vacuolar-type H+-ATPase subunit F/Vma7